MRARAAAVAVLLAGAVALPVQAAAGAGAGAAPAPQQAGRQVVAAAVPDLAWDECGEDFGGGDGPAGSTFSCAWAELPLDHADPGGETIQVALKRLEARQPERKKGTLFLNPGGPGGSGVDFASVAWALFPRQVLNQFDVVGFDPRGVARSNPLVCFRSFQQLDRVFAGTPPFPVDEREYRMLDRSFDRYTDLCERRGGDIQDHMSTGDVARDLDLLRQAVGDERLTYAGYSYGTQLGSTYANLFPQNVRALVLDGVLDPVAWTTGRDADDAALPFSSRLGSDQGASDTLGQFLALCSQAGPERCSLAAQGDPRAVYDATMAVLREEPVRVDLGGGFVFEVTYQDVVGASLGTFYSPYFWSDLAALVSEVAAAAGVADPVAPPEAAQAERVAAFAGAPMPQTLEGFDGVACSDSVNPTDRRAWWDAGRARDEQAPYFGSLWTWASGACADWPGASEGAYRGPWTAQTASPVLVVGNTYDPATPYSGAQAVAGLLPGSRLLTVEGWGHTSLGYSTCADQAVARYLVNGRLPAPGTRCAFDAVPFDDAVAPEVPAAAARSGEVGTVDQRAAAIERAREIVTGSLPGGAGR
jgi:pimeloyl-ACP methyl ester carboxylesterase